MSGLRLKRQEGIKMTMNFPVISYMEGDLLCEYVSASALHSHLGLGGSVSEWFLLAADECQLNEWLDYTPSHDVTDFFHINTFAATVIVEWHKDKNTPKLPPPRDKPNYGRLTKKEIVLVHCHTFGYVYAVVLDNGIVKVGKSKRPKERIGTHKRTIGKAAKIAEIVISPLHSDYTESENKLIELNGGCEMSGDGDAESIIEFIGKIKEADEDDLTNAINEYEERKHKSENEYEKNGGFFGLIAKRKPPENK